MSKKEIHITRVAFGISAIEIWFLFDYWCSELGAYLFLLPSYKSYSNNLHSMGPL